MQLGKWSLVREVGSGMTTEYGLIPLLPRQPVWDEVLVPPKAATPRARSGQSTFPKRSDKTEHWRRIGRETQRASSSSYVSHSLLGAFSLTFDPPRLVSLLLPWQLSSLRATSNCPLIPVPQQSSFCNRYPTNFPRSRRAALPPPPLSQPIPIHLFIRPHPPFALTSSGSSA